MVKPILYALDMSPPCRAVYMTGEAIGIDFEIREIDLFKGDHMTESFLKMNPQHCVPTLDDNGFIIWDSHAIMCYLVDKYAKDDKLYPKDLQKRAVVNQRLHFENTIFTFLRLTFRPVIYKGMNAIPEEKMKLLQDTFADLDKLLEGKKWLAGDSYTLADISCVSSISTLTAIVRLDNYPNVKEWLKRCEKELPGYQKLNTPGCDKVKSVLLEKLEAK